MFGIYLFFAIGILTILVGLVPTLLAVINWVRVEFASFKEEFKALLKIKEKKIKVKKASKIKDLDKVVEEKGLELEEPKEEVDFEVITAEVE